MKSFFTFLFLLFFNITPSFAIICRETPWFVGRDSTSTKMDVERTASSSNPLPVTMNAKLYDRWAFERREIEWRWERCRYFSSVSSSSETEMNFDRIPPPPPRPVPPRPVPPRPVPPRPDHGQWCRVPYEVCRVYYKAENEQPISQTVHLYFPAKTTLKSGQKEALVLTYHPLHKGPFGSSEALKVDVWSWHNWYKAVRKPSSALDPGKVIDVQMETVF